VFRAKYFEISCRRFSGIFFVRGWRTGMHQPPGPSQSWFLRATSEGGSPCKMATARPAALVSYGRRAALDLCDLCGLCVRNDWRSSLLATAPDNAGCCIMECFSRRKRRGYTPRLAVCCTLERLGRATLEAVPWISRGCAIIAYFPRCGSP